MGQYLYVLYWKQPGTGAGGDVQIPSTALPCLASRARIRPLLAHATCLSLLLESLVWNQHFPLYQAEGQPKSELICGHDTISHPGGWAHCKLCYIISLRMTGGEIWAPVVLFHWYRLEGSSKVGHASLRASPAGRGSTLKLLECGLCTSAKSMSRRLSPAHGAAWVYWVQQESCFSLSVHH